MVSHRTKLLFGVVFEAEFFIAFPLNPENWSVFIDSGIPYLYERKNLKVDFSPVDFVTLIEGNFE